MKDRTYRRMLLLFAAAAFVAIVALLVRAAGDASADCYARGGIMVRGLCVDPQPAPTTTPPAASHTPILGGTS